MKQERFYLHREKSPAPGHVEYTDGDAWNLFCGASIDPIEGAWWAEAVGHSLAPAKTCLSHATCQKCLGVLVETLLSGGDS